MKERKTEKKHIKYNKKAKSAKQAMQAGRQRERTEAVRQEKGQRVKGQSRRDRERRVGGQHVENMLNTWSRQGREKERERLLYGEKERMEQRLLKAEGKRSLQLRDTTFLGFLTSPPRKAMK